MAWELTFVVIFGGLLLLFASGMPVAFCFLVLILIGGAVLWNGGAGLEQVVLSLMNSVNNFTLLPIPLFILMGEVMFRSGVAPQMIDALDKWLGKLPGRLSLLAVGGGVLFSTLTGVSSASVAMLGETLVPEMARRGYHKSMSMGPILGSGGLAVMIPPSGMAVVLAALGEISAGKLLIAIIVPGLIMAAAFAVYIISRCWLQPNLAPAYEVPHIPVSQKLIDTVKYILPLAFIVFLVTGVIFMGIATPTEAAATGAAGTFILAAAYGRLSWQTAKSSVMTTIDVTVMLLIIMAAANAFGQILAYTQVTTGLSRFALSISAVPILIMIAMQIVGLVLGMFINVTSVMVLTIPVFMPIVNAMGFDQIWFGVIYLLNMEIGTVSPPFGLNLFVMKGVAPPGTTMNDIYRAALPFFYIQLGIMALMIAFPVISAWLPSLMR